MKNLFRSLVAVSITIILTWASLAQGRRIVEHLVQSKETVYSIAQRYGTTVDKVYELNPWAKSAIKSGDKLIIYTNAQFKQEGASLKSGVKQHNVVSGETIYRIARNYGLSEEELLKANPGVSSYNLQSGMTLHIPQAKGQSQRNEGSSDTTSLRKDSLVEETTFVRVLLMLPFQKATRYLEFYQGFLMGMNELKKSGVNIHLKALDAEDDAAVTDHIFNGSTQHQDLVIGGVTEEQVRLIAQSTRSGYYIVPFSGVEGVSSSNLIQINQSSSDVIDRVVEHFIEKYQSKNIIFTRHTEGKEEAFSTSLKRTLRERQISYYTWDLSTSLPKGIDKNCVVVACSADKTHGELLLQTLPGNKGIALFGYPQWQSFGDLFTKKLHEHQATIYSTFFFDKRSSEGRQFLTKFNAWYNKKVTDTYPKYSVLGYDVACYFIGAFAKYGNRFIEETSNQTNDGLQIGISLEKSMNHGGYTNRAFYLINYEPDGSTTRQTLQ